MPTYAPDNINDKQLLKAIEKKDSRAFYTFYKRYKDFVARKFYSRVDLREEAEDLIQEFWSAMWERPVTINTNSAVYFLLHLVVVWLSRYYRTKKGNALLAIDELNKEPKELQYSHVFEELEAEELFCLIEQKKENLQESDRRVYDLCQKQHYSFSEVALMLKTTQQTVQNKFNYSCRMIRMQVQQHYSRKQGSHGPSLKPL